MRLSFLIALSGFVAFTAHLEALDLTPRRSFRELEGGVKLPILIFTDAGRKAEYVPPVEWNVTGGGPVLNLQSPELHSVKAKFSVIPRNPRSGSLMPNDAKQLEDSVLAMIPPEAEDVKKAAVNESPFMLGSKPSREFIITYRIRDAEAAKSIAVLDLSDRERFIVEVSGSAKEFNAARDAVIRSLFSWEWQEEVAARGKDKFGAPAI